MAVSGRSRGGSGYHSAGGSGLWLTSGRHILIRNNHVTLDGSVVEGGGYIYDAGGTLKNLMVNKGDLISAFGGAHLVDDTLNGGTMIIKKNTSVTDETYTASGGTVILGPQYNLSQSFVVSNHVVFSAQTKATIGEEHILSGGSFVVSSGSKILSEILVSSGGVAAILGTAGSGSIDLVGAGGEVVVSGLHMPSNVISNVTSGNQIDMRSIASSSIANVTRTDSTITFNLQNGSAYTISAPGTENETYRLMNDGHGGTIYHATCFAAGTLIATPEGEAAVEALSAGDLVMTPKGAMPVRWVGHRSITVADQRVPEENWLVRIRASALSDGVPSRDLLVTQEHCMVFEGKLVPARMLVNGVSVLLDRSIGVYTYHHVELETHEALWAEGALTESYLDTGNRDQFENNAVTALYPERIAAGSVSLPLDTSRGFVEPLHAAIAARAGIASDAPAPVSDLTDDPGVHLVTDRGLVVAAQHVRGAYHVFHLPAEVSAVVITSRVMRPDEAIGPMVLSVRIGAKGPYMTVRSERGTGLGRAAAL